MDTALLRHGCRCGVATGKILKGSISRNLMQHTIRGCKPSGQASLTVKPRERCLDTLAGCNDELGLPHMTSLDSFKCRKTLKVGSKTYVYYSLPTAEKNGLEGISKLPYSMKVLLENLLRNEDGRTVKKEDIVAVSKWM